MVNTIGVHKCLYKMEYGHICNQNGPRLNTFTFVINHPSTRSLYSYLSSGFVFPMTHGIISAFTNRKYKWVNIYLPLYLIPHEHSHSRSQM